MLEIQAMTVNNIMQANNNKTCHVVLLKLYVTNMRKQCMDELTNST